MNHSSQVCEAWYGKWIINVPIKHVQNVVYKLTVTSMASIQISEGMSEEFSIEFVS